VGEESRCLADQPFFFCGSATLRQRALRPQLKREPLGSAMIECLQSNQVMTVRVLNCAATTKGTSLQDSTVEGWTPVSS